MASYAAGGRAMTLGSVFSRAFAAIGASPLIFFGTSFLLSALPYTLFTLASIGFDFSVPQQGHGGSFWAVGVAVVVGWLALYCLAQAIILRATVVRIDGAADGPGDIFAAGVRALLPLLGLTVLYWLGVWIGCLLLLVPGIILGLMWAVAAPTLVAERDGVFAAFGRSRYLTKDARWRILGLFLVVFVIYLLASSIAGVVGVAGTIGAGGLAGTVDTTGAPRSLTVVTTVLTAALQTLFVAISTAIQGALYVELRDWKDGHAGDRLADIFA